MLTMRFSVAINGRLVHEEDLPATVDDLARSLDIVEIEGAVRVFDSDNEIIFWSFVDLNWVVVGIASHLDLLFRGAPYAVTSPGLTIELRTANESVVISGGKKRFAFPRRELLRELYDLCRRFVQFWQAAVRHSEATLQVIDAVPARHIEMFGGAMRRPSILPVVAAICRTASTVKGGPQGTFDFLVGDSMIRVGPLAQALLPQSVRRLADGIAKLRAGQVIVPVVLGYNTLWITQQKAGARQCASICYRDTEAGLMVREELDAECGRAAWEFLEHSAPEDNGTSRHVAKVWPPPLSVPGASVQ
jgi:hypothetical protein